MDTVRGELDHAILMKLMNTAPPPRPCKVTVNDGCLVVTAPDLYTLHLTLCPVVAEVEATSPGEDDYTWKVLGFELHVDPKRAVESFQLTLEQKKRIVKRLNDKLEEYAKLAEEKKQAVQDGTIAAESVEKDNVLAQGLHVYMLSVCRQLQMVILRQQFTDLQQRSYAAGLTVLDSPPHLLQIESVQ